jgi:hypothetical protein
MVITGHADGSIYLWKNMDENEREKIIIEEDIRDKSQAG